MRSHDHLHHQSSGNGAVDAERRLIGYDGEDQDDGGSYEDECELAADRALRALINGRDSHGADELADYLRDHLVENLLAAARGRVCDGYGHCTSAQSLLSTMALEWALSRKEDTL